jgi:hypothetical protein
MIVFLKKFIAPQAATAKLFDPLSGERNANPMLYPYGFGFASSQGQKCGVVPMPVENVEQGLTPEVPEW